MRLTWTVPLDSIALWNVTLPMLSPTLLFAAVVGVIGALQIFDLPVRHDTGRTRRREPYGRHGDVRGGVQEHGNRVWFRDGCDSVSYSSCQ